MAEVKGATVTDQNVCLEVSGAEDEILGMEINPVVLLYSELLKAAHIDR
jgi:hypothetical protein